MKFLADEHIDLHAVKALKRLGIDIISIQDANMESYVDEEILNYGNKNKRAIITQDSDFLRLHAKNIENAGIIFLTKPLNISELIKEIQRILIIFENLENAVIFIPLK
ncbi:DUF5615 family PIN-like protein [Candidatus Woesearchaeota archaeon]|nr:DUF5615 family PIN-like protein [Candidatus Woesearchaeota archaeon]